MWLFCQVSLKKKTSASKEKASFGENWALKAHYIVELYSWQLAHGSLRRAKRPTSWKPSTFPSNCLSLEIWKCSAWRVRSYKADIWSIWSLFLRNILKCNSRKNSGRK